MTRHTASPETGLVHAIAIKAIKWRGRRYEIGDVLPALSAEDAAALGDRIAAGASEADIRAEIAAGRLPPDALARLEAGEDVVMRLADSSQAVRPPEGGGEDGDRGVAGATAGNDAAAEGVAVTPSAITQQDSREGRSGTAREAPGATDGASAPPAGVQPAAPTSSPEPSAPGDTPDGVSGAGYTRPANAEPRGRAGR